jgi:DNA-directed RNA polymerase subunit RPC12/RpoP
MRDLFPTVPKRARLVRMHVEDSGHLPGGSPGIRFRCRRCGHDTGWIPDTASVSENKRGRPCPYCNQEDVPHA